jgi:hypothetical protein
MSVRWSFHSILDFVLFLIGDPYKRGEEQLGVTLLLRRQ